MKILNRKIAGLMIALIFILPICPVFAAPAAPLAPVEPTLATQPPVAPSSPQPPASPSEQPADESKSQTIENLTQPDASGVALVAGSCEISECVTGKDGSQSLGNQNTGPDSENSTDVATGSSAEITNSNQAAIQNDILGAANTGENSASYNTGNGNVATGDSNITLTLLNLINTNVIALPGGMSIFILKNILSSMVGDYILDPASNEAYDLNGSRVTVENSNTGSGSTNDAAMSAVNGLVINNENAASVANNVNLSASTGGNNASYNTGSGSISSGDANISASILNFLNSNFYVTGSSVIAVINILGDWVGDLLLPESYKLGTGETVVTSVAVKNAGTGAGSENNATYTSAFGLDIQNQNVADVGNDIVVSSTSGSNNSSFNTGGGMVATGDSVASVQLGNQGNQNIISDMLIYIAVNVLGNWSGSILLPMGNNGVVVARDVTVSNNTTGSESVNNASYEETKEIEITNANNAAISNNINLVSNTGENGANYNTGDGKVSSGDAKAALNLLNVFNTNIFAGKVLYLIVNVLGDWTGDIGIAEENGGTEKQNNKKIIKIAKNSQSHTTNIFEVFGEDFGIEVNESANQDKTSAVLAATSGGYDLEASGSETPQESFWKKYLGLIFGSLFLVYVASLSVLARRRRNRLLNQGGLR